MTWAANPFFTPREQDVDDPEALPRQVIVKGVKDGFLAPSKHFTGHQALYVLVPHCIVAAIISGGINLAIAEGMYGTTDQAINLFQFPNTLVGDATVTVVIQCILTWMIELILVNNDLRAGKVQPVGCFREPTSDLLRWYLFLGRPEGASEGGCVMHWLLFLISQALRALMVAVVSFAILIGPCIGFLTLVGTPSGRDWTFIATIHPSLGGWKPQIFKGILGAVLAVLTTPLFALFWLTRCGWALINNEKHYGQS